MATDSSEPKLPSAGLLLEQYGPLIFSAIGGAMVVLWRDEITHLVNSKQLDINNLYSAVLNWASIQIGFAFAVYGFVVGKTQGFVEAVRDTIAMRRFLSYVKRANVGGFVLTATSIPLAVVAPSPDDSQSSIFWLVTIWFCLFLWTFFAFLRIAYNFGHLTSVRDQAPFHGA